MQAYKEKYLGRRGNHIIKARVVELNTKQTGKVRRAELVLEEVVTPGIPREHDGWSLADIEQLHALLVNYIKETNENP